MSMGDCTLRILECGVLNVVFFETFMKIYIFLLLLVSCASISNAQTKTKPVVVRTYAALKYDSLVIYDYEGRPEGRGMFIVEDGKLVKSVTKSARLEMQTAIALTKMFEQKSSYGESEAFCFEPHLGIVYWRQGKPVAYISICMTCNVLSPNIEISIQKKTVKIGSETEIIKEGMSKEFRKYLNGLLTKYKFSHQSKD